MSDQIVITVPDDIYARARQIAETSGQPIEKVLLDHLKTLPLPTLPSDVQAELDALPHLSDDALWTIAREQMQDDIQARAQALMDKNSREQITDKEYHELEQLVERGDRLMLRKAEASAILRSRHKLKS